MAADSAMAKQRVRERLAATMASGKIDVYLRPLGIVDQVAAMVKQVGEAGLRDRLPEDWVHQLAVVGTAEACADTIGLLKAGGADSVGLVPMMDNDVALTIYADAQMQQL